MGDAPDVISFTASKERKHRRIAEPCLCDTEIRVYL